MRTTIVLLALLLSFPAMADHRQPAWPRSHAYRLYPRTYPFRAVCLGEFYTDRQGRVRCRMRIR